MEKTEIRRSVLEFHCPRYAELPNMNLYLDQVLTLVNDALEPVRSEPLTGAMLNNYVKNKSVQAPVKKRYTREHLTYIIVTSLLKQVFSLQQIAQLLKIQQSTYPLETAYDYFCEEYENALAATFDFTGEAMPRVETKQTDQTVLMRSVVLAAANRVYAEKMFLSGE